MELIAAGIINVNFFWWIKKVIQPAIQGVLKKNMTFLAQEVPKP